MISATAWIARGKSAQHPSRYNVDDSELERVSKMANISLEEAKAQLERAQNEIAAGRDPDGDGEWHDEADGDDNLDEDEGEGENAAGEGEDQEMGSAENKQREDPDDLSRYNLDEYDEEKPVGAAMGAFSNMKGLQFYRSNDEDPYITMKDDGEDEENEREELEIYPTDNLILTAKTEDEVSLLEAYVYSSKDSNLYVHHDLMLPSFPLCLEWLDYTPAPFDADQNGSSSSSNAGRLGSFVAVGTMDPEIEIWSMDVVEGLYPDAILGRKDLTEGLDAPSGSGKKKRRVPKARIANPDYHVDAVLSLSWNPMARNLLASASADKTVKLWDLSRPNTGSDSRAFRSFDCHTDKVQSVSWQAGAPGSQGTGNPAVLLTGSYDKTIRVFDTRSPETAVVANIGADVEAVRWNGWRENQFLVSLETGIVQSFDARYLPSVSQNTPTTVTPTVFTLAAHDSACTSLDISPHIPGCIVTGGSDKMIKVWNLDESDNGSVKGVSMVTSRDLDVGKVFSVTFCPDEPLTLAAAGSKGKLQIWDTLSNVGVRKTFGDRIRKLNNSNVRIDGDEPARGDGVVGIDDEDDEDNDEDQVILPQAAGGADDEAMQE
ncbi:WD40 repeat-like protein [Violaceomyces palustris]|uniref:WD40 repeat-like protein n=1 Tax=Violaceomyces palustris TaxID=1673888 RepID=A0ACD0P5G4_9BASI|nr:WD40 repeat-like protein [Violaceomyces palustris]